jgi:hypothetical protein
VESVLSGNPCSMSARRRAKRNHEAIRAIVRLTRSSCPEAIVRTKESVFGATDICVAAFMHLG